MTPENVFDRNWALTLLAGVLSRVHAECHRKGKGVLFEHMKPFLTGPGGRSYHQLGRTLEMSEGAVKQAVHRLRRRYRSLVRRD